jgi:HSP20 family molecular chaperone IbpA
MSQNNQSTSNQEFINPENIRILKNAAGAGVKMVDTFLTNVTPHIEAVIKDFFSETPSYSNQTNKKTIKYYKKETPTNILIACEIPRVSIENCAVKLYNGALVVMAKIEQPEPLFEFLSNEEYLVDIDVPKYVRQKDITARCLNGMLYITVNTHLLDTDCNIDITN